GRSGVRVAVATFGRPNTCQLALHLRSNPAATSDLHTLEMPAYRLAEDSMVAFRFPPLANSANKWFYFVAESPDGAPGDAVSFWATPATGDGDGHRSQRYEDGLPSAGELVMSLEFNEAAS